MVPTKNYQAVKKISYILFALLLTSFAYSQCTVCDVSFSNQNVSGSFTDGKTYCVSATNNDYTLSANPLNGSSTIEICTDAEDTVYINTLNNYSSTGKVKVNGNAVVNISTFNDSRLDFEVASGGYLRFQGKTTLNSSGGTFSVDNYGTVYINGDFEVNNGREIHNRPGGVFTVADGFQMNSSSKLRNEGVFNVYDLRMNTNTQVNTIGGIINIANDFEMSGTGSSFLTTGSTPPNCGAVIYGGTFSFNSGAIIDSSSYVTPVGAPNGCASVLPIDLVSFTGKYQQGITKLRWTTAVEKNNEFFTLEKSSNGINFTPFATIDGAGNSQYVLDYSYTDEAPYSGVTYYRLKQTDYDGKYEYSAIIAVRTDDLVFSVYPNPANDFITVEAMASNVDENSIKILLTDLQQASKNAEVQYKGTGEYQLPTSSLLPGFYLLKVVYASSSYTTPVIITH